MRSFFIFLFLGWTLTAWQEQPGNFVAVEKGDTVDAIVEKAARLTPSSRQLDWQMLEFTAFAHFGMNTFAGDRVEWGTGHEDPDTFNPDRLDCRQWVKVCKEAGIRLIIPTCKHHDGFCMWQTDTTDYSVKSSAWRNGRGDVVKELSDACQEEGLRFGIYLSPWDKHEQTYGTEAYNDFFVAQLTELLTRYGPVHEVWFDGACGEGPNGKRQVYDFPRYYEVIRKLAPGAVIAVMGPDVRWVGNESGLGRETEWSVVPVELMDREKIAGSSQQEADVFVPRDRMGKDLGSREKIATASALAWYPSEVDVSIRPGWFFHADENPRVKSPQELVEIYYSSIGRNSLLLLNIPPDRRGLFHENDVASLMGMRKYLDDTFDSDLSAGAAVEADSTAQGVPVNVFNGLTTAHWMPTDARAELTLTLPKPRWFDVALFQEDITVGQRVEAFVLEAWDGQSWLEVVRGTTIGYKRLLRFPALQAKKLRFRVLQSRLAPAIGRIGLFKSPPDVEIEPAGGAFSGTVMVQMKSEAGASVHFTLNGKDPTQASTKYTEPFKVTATTRIRARAFQPDGDHGFIEEAVFNKARYNLMLRSRYSPRHTAGGSLALVDGVTGTKDFRDGCWQGYEGGDLDATILLGKEDKVRSVSVRFLRDTRSWIFFPSEVEILVSDDGRDFRSVKVMKNDPPVEEKPAQITGFYVDLGDAAPRMIRVVARNIGTCPEWHPGAGNKAWLFCDEILLN
jgi:alpha-L-fucosidase